MDCKEAVTAIKGMSILTYCYYFNGFYIKLHSHAEIHRLQEIEDYEKKVNALFKIKVNLAEEGMDRSKKVEIDNSTPFFIWPFVEEGFATMFKPEQVQSLPISVFIYNKNRRPLKVNCDLLWVLSPSLYYFRKRARSQIKVVTPRKETGQTVDVFMMPHIRHKMNRERQFSMKQHKSLLKGNRQRGHSELVQLSLLSETLNIKKH